MGITSRVWDDTSTFRSQDTLDSIHHRRQQRSHHRPLRKQDRTFYCNSPTLLTKTNPRPHNLRLVVHRRIPAVTDRPFPAARPYRTDAELRTTREEKRGIQRGRECPKETLGKTLTLRRYIPKLLLPRNPRCLRRRIPTPAINLLEIRNKTTAVTHNHHTHTHTHKEPSTTKIQSSHSKKQRNQYNHHHQKTQGTRRNEHKTVGAPKNTTG